MADPVAFAEEAAAAAAAEPEKAAPTFEGENKFQHAISVWRSEWKAALSGVYSS